MERRYWDALARSYRRRVVDAFTYETNGALRRALDEQAGPRRRVADLGCGVGLLLPWLARRFGKVIGVDFSARSLQAAARRCRRIPNVELVEGDLREPAGKPVADVAVSLNALLDPREDRRAELLAGLASRVKRGGTLVLVVPSLESVLYVLHREREIHDGPADVDLSDLCGARTPRDGVVRRGGVATKHFLREELELLLPRHGLRVARIEKVEYAWSTEYLRPPRFLRAPYPWDWLVTSRRVGTP